MTKKRTEQTAVQQWNEEKKMSQRMRNRKS